MPTIHCLDIGLMDYMKAWDYQKQLFEDVLSQRLSESVKDHALNLKNHFILCEHPHVYTLGKSGQENNLLIDPVFLKSIDATFYRTDRGGDITYHGPGQIVGYPIVDLELMNLGIRRYIWLLEEVIIQTLANYNLGASRLDGATGVWLDSTIPGKTRKICAIGVKVSRGITMHGFALNVNTDLKYFNYINPCGFVDKGVTSIEKEIDRKIVINEVKEILKDNFTRLFDLVEI